MVRGGRGRSPLFPQLEPSEQPTFESVGPDMCLLEPFDEHLMKHDPALPSVGSFGALPCGA
eukprot:11985417-Alexandrium_andersonii.AAC.1